jgi:hypothetical protein
MCPADDIIATAALIPTSTRQAGTGRLITISRATISSRCPRSERLSPSTEFLGWPNGRGRDAGNIAGQ